MQYPSPVSRDPSLPFPQTTSGGYPAIAAELATGVAIAAPLFPPGDIRRYGAPMNGGNDDSSGITNALTVALAFGASTLVLPSGVIVVNTPISLGSQFPGAAPGGLTIAGYGDNTLLKIGSGCAGLTAITAFNQNNTDGASSAIRLLSFRVDGTAAPGCTGLLLTGIAPGTPSGYMVLSDVRVMHCTGTGIVVQDVVGLAAERVYCGRNGINLYVQGTIASLPTVIEFVRSQFREAVTKGVKIDQGYNVSFRKVVMEANTQEGLYVVPLAGQNVTMLQLDDVWMEDNYNGDATKYQALLDGSAAGTVEVHLKSVRIGSSAAHSLHLKGIFNFVINDLRPQNLAADVLIEGGAGTIENWSETNTPFATVVSMVPNGLVDFPKRHVPAFDQIVVSAGNPAVIDIYNGSIHELDVIDGTAFTINSPLNGFNGAHDQTIRVKNVAGAALGAITWGAKYKMAAWVNPAAGFSRSVTFTYDPNSTNWYEISRTSTDIAN